eukprot:6452471-Amphidinium_carterae.1
MRLALGSGTDSLLSLTSHIPQPMGEDVVVDGDPVDSRVTCSRESLTQEVAEEARATTPARRRLALIPTERSRQPDLVIDEVYKQGYSQ